MTNDIDHYKVLGVSRDASADEIKKAYRRQTHKYHPDKNPSNNAAAKKMKEINAACEILSDEVKRAEYDKSKGYSCPHQKEAYQKEDRNEKSNAYENKSHSEAKDDERKQAQQEMKSREEVLNKREEKLKAQEEQLNKTKKSIRRERVFAAVIVVMAIVVTIGSFKQSPGNNNQKSISQADSIGGIITAYKFLLKRNNIVSDVQTVININSIYNALGSNITFEAFVDQIQNKQNAQKIFEQLESRGNRIKMSFDQFYKSVKMND